jgi:Rne/Rng family ribonuclease
MDILIEESEGCLWAAALIKGRLQGLEIDPLYEEIRWGSIFHATVKSIDSTRDAAYLDLDGNHTGILFNKDIRLIDEDGNTVKGGEKAVGQYLQSGDTILVQAKTAFISSSDDPYIGESKLTELSMDIAIQGRHLIYCPLMDKNRLSQRVKDKKLRTQIETMLQALEESEDFTGFILRAAAANTQTDILRREAEMLGAIWNQIETQQDEESAPGLLIEGPDAIQRILSDNATQHIETIEVVTMDHFTHIENWSSVFAPDLMTKITPVELSDATEDLALFHERDIMGQIEDLFQTYCILPSGGNLIIQHTAALTSIDVNKGGDNNSHLSTNLEAATEAIRQIRLRNIGGVIMIDFINMKKKEQETLREKIEIEAAKDPCTVQIHGFTGSGMAEISRKRRTPPLHKRIDWANL